MAANSSIFMQRALDLAKLGIGNVSPNPLVGCVIVHDDKIIGEGFHQKYGEAHAEVNAINAVKNKLMLSLSTVYVTLEPCSHFGKTPPCADLLIHHKVKKVVICNEDPFELVAGNGIKKLREAGIEVETGILAGAGRFLNRRFFTFIEQKRPYIILKWAESADGFVAAENFEPIKISNELSHKMAHKFRAEEDAIMVGTNTAVFDNPKLTVREWSGKNPLRVVIDKNLRLPKHFNFFNNEAKALIINELDNKIEGKNEFIKIEFNQDFLQEILRILYEKKIQSLLVEGGTQLLQTFIDAQIFDEIRIFKSSKNLEKGISAPILPKNVSLISKENLLEDEFFIYQKK